VKQAIRNHFVGFLLGVAFTLVLIQLWGLAWVHLIAPNWGPGI